MSDDSGRRWDRAQKRAQGGGGMSPEEQEIRRQLLRERAPSIEDRDHEAERVDRIQRLREKRHP